MSENANAAWIEIERDERYRIVFVVYRCRSCKRLGVSSNPFLSPTPCACSQPRE